MTPAELREALKEEVFENPAIEWPEGYPWTIEQREEPSGGGWWMMPPCSISGCYRESGFMGSPFCEECIWRLWAHIDSTQPEHKKEMARRGRIQDIRAHEEYQLKQAQSANERIREADRRDRSTEAGTIYYLRVGDLIKIGYSSDFEQRLKHYPPNTELLAQHPGTRKTERQMHHKFLHRLSSGREWFTPCQEIDQHIAAVKKSYAQPNLEEAR